MVSPRFLPVSSVPAVLWDAAKQTLLLPEVLKTAYLAELENLGLTREAAETIVNERPAGGPTEAATRSHFARRYAASCGRVALAVLDPRDELLGVSDQILHAFAGGRVALLDVPCGAGAGGLALLSAIAALRREGVLPAVPLDVHVVGGDVSVHAIDIARRMSNRLSTQLSYQGISLSSEFLLWDVTDPSSTVDLLHRWTTVGHNARMHFVVAANFSAFLGSDSNLKKARGQLEQIFLWAGQRESRIVWLEPQTKEAHSLFSRLGAKLGVALRRMGWWRPIETPERPYAKTACKQLHLFRPDRFWVRLSVILLRDTKH